MGEYIAVQRRTFFARDHAGLQPVFYARHGDLVKVASSPKALVALPGVSRALNRVALADALCHRYPDPGETFYQAVRRLPSGCLALVAGGNVTVQRYWDPFPASGRRHLSEDGEEEQFAALQERAVARCLPAGRAGIFLSGGLDSVTIASCASGAK